jgi:hypothetical protein
MMILGLRLVLQEDALVAVEFLGNRQCFLGGELPQQVLGIGIDDLDHGAAAVFIDREFDAAVDRLDEAVDRRDCLVESCIVALAAWTGAVLLTGDAVAACAVSVTWPSVRPADFEDADVPVKALAA